MPPQSTVVPLGFSIERSYADGLANNVLSEVSEEGRKAARASSLAILRANESGDSFSFAHVGGTGKELLGHSISLGRGLAGNAALLEETLRIPRARDDERFEHAFDEQVTNRRTGSTIVVPVFSEERVSALIQVVNYEGEPKFSKRDEKRLVSFAGFVRDAVSTLESVESERKRSLEPVSGSVFFADIKGFHQICKMNGERTGAELLKRWFGSASTVLQDEGADYVKCTGDGCLVVFRDETHPGEHLQSAIRSAHAMQQLAILEGIPLRLGLRSGEFLYGNLGTESLPHHDFVGLEVNEAKRLEQSGEVGKVTVYLENDQLLDALPQELRSLIELKR